MPSDDIDESRAAVVPVTGLGPLGAVTDDVSTSDRAGGTSEVAGARWRREAPSDPPLDVASVAVSQRESAACTTGQDATTSDQNSDLDGVTSGQDMSTSGQDKTTFDQDRVLLARGPGRSGRGGSATPEVVLGPESSANPEFLFAK